MKFTEEQYREIIRTHENNYGSDNKAMAVIRVVDNFNDSLSYNEAFALANPVTREWAHEQFVEKEKKYLWTTPLVAGIKYALIKENGKYVLSDMYLTGKGTPLTELEVVNIGLKTDWFDKEEV